MSNRSTIISALAGVVGGPELSLGSAISQSKEIDIKDLDSNSFPIAHVLDNLEELSYLPFNQIQATIYPLVRMFYTAQTLIQIQATLTTLKDLFNASTSLGNSDFVRVEQTSWEVDQETNFVDIRIQFIIQYRYTHGSA